MIKRLIILLLLTATAFATVTDTTTKHQYYQPNGSVTTFTFTMPCNSSDDIKVEKILTSTGNPETLVVDTDYTIAATNSDYLNGGVVTIDPALAGTYDLTITRQIVGTQELSSGAVTHNTIEDALDKITRIGQDNRNKISLKVIRIPDSDPSTAYAELENYKDRAGKVLGFDGTTGAPVAVEELPSTSATVSTYMKTVMDDASAILAIATLNGMPVFNVMNPIYGATGDGNDDATAINLATTAASAAGAGIVYFPTPSSKYAVSAPIVVPSNVWLVSQYAEIELIASSDDHVIENSDASGGNSNIRIIGLHIDANGGNQGGGAYHGIYLNNVTNFKVLNCFIEDADEIGIVLTDCTSFEISGNRTTTADLHGISVNASTIGVITKNESYSNGHNGIHVLGSSAKITVSNNITHDNGTTVLHHGVYMLETSNYTLSNNISYDNAGEGLQSRECTDGTITGNNCYSNGRMGISFYEVDTGASKAVITGNSCRGNTSHGIAVNGFTGGFELEFVVVSGNYCGGNGGRGINLGYASNCSVTGNVCENNGAEGIRLISNCNENIVANNIVKDNSQDGSGSFNGILIATNSKRNIISGNFIRGSNHNFSIREASGSDENRIIDNITLDETDTHYSTVGPSTIVEAANINRFLTHEGDILTHEGEILTY